MAQTKSSVTGPLIPELSQGIRVFANPTCFVCGAEGTPVYANLRDRISTADGEWNFKQCRNPGCGLWWLDPMPHHDDIGKAYQDYFTHDDVSPSNPVGIARRLYRVAKAAYLQQQFGYSCESSALASVLGKLLTLLPNRTNYADMNVMYLPSTKGGRLLDVGCGNGATLRIMQDLGWVAEGIDFDPVIVENAKSKGLNVRLGTLKEQYYDDNSFDAIVMCHVIEHIHEPLELLRECRRVLKPGGRLVVLTPNVDSWGHRRFQRSWLFLDPPRHIFLFNIGTLRQLAVKAGLETLVARTSARTAGRMIIGSRDIAACEKHDIRKPLSLSLHFVSESVEFAEWLYSKLNSVAGEEIVFIATKEKTDLHPGRAQAKAI